MTRQQYVEINGKRYDLNVDGHARLEGESGSILHRHVIQALSLEIKTDIVPFMNLPEGLYEAAFATSPERFVKNYEEWYKVSGDIKEVTMATLVALKKAHLAGRLFHLTRGEATNA